MDYQSTYSHPGCSTSKERSGTTGYVSKYTTSEIPYAQPITSLPQAGPSRGIQCWEIDKSAGLEVKKPSDM